MMTTTDLCLHWDWRNNLTSPGLIETMFTEAYTTASYSPDPSTQVGAILVTRDDCVFAECNRPPAWITPEQLVDRDFKNRHIIHAERGVIYKAIRAGKDVQGAVMFAPWAPCVSCAQTIAQLHLDALVVWRQATEMTPERWMTSVIEGQDAIRQSTVRLLEYEGTILTRLQVLMDGQAFEPGNVR